MVVGVDGGGTKTDVVVAGLDGAVLASVRVGCTNHETVGMARAMDELRTGVLRALEAGAATLDDVRASAFGLAGVDWSSDEQAIDAAVGAFGLAGPRTVVNDSAVALRAGSSLGWGIVSSIGTGAVTAGRDRQGRWFRTMSVGWGEPCGSSSLVRDALHAVAAQHHRTGPPTSLTERFVEAFAVTDVLAMFEGISRGRLAVDGRFAPLLQQAVDAGDAVADDVLCRSGIAHAAMVVGAADHLGMLDDTFELVTSGGVHAGGGRFVEAFLAAVRDRCPNAVPTPLVQPPVDGAVELALELSRR